MCKSKSASCNVQVPLLLADILQRVNSCYCQRWFTFCRDAIHILKSEIGELHEQLEADRRTKEIVQKGYDELTVTVETNTTRHKETMTSFQTRLADGKRFSAEMTFKVSLPRMSKI